MTSSSNMDRAVAGWGDTMPDEIRALAQACDHDGQAAIARRLGISAATVNKLINNRYGARLAELSPRLTAFLGAARIQCPAVNVGIRQRQCFEYRRGLRNPAMAHVFRACCPTCRHNRDIHPQVRRAAARKSRVEP